MCFLWLRGVDENRRIPRGRNNNDLARRGAMEERHDEDVTMTGGVRVQGVTEITYVGTTYHC